MQHRNGNKGNRCTIFTNFIGKSMIVRGKIIILVTNVNSSCLQALQMSHTYVFWLCGHVEFNGPNPSEFTLAAAK